MPTDNNKYPFNVYWTIPECEIPYSEMSAALSAAGFGPDEIPEPTMRQQTARCVKSFHSLRGANRVLADAASDNEKEASYALLERSSGTSSEAVSYNEDTRIVFDKETQTTSATGAQGVAFMERLNNRFVGNVSAEDIRAWLGRVVSRSAGVPKRPSGGIYIVPGRFRPVFELVQKLFESLGKGAHLYIERVYMGDEETANIQTSVIDFVSKKIGEISDKASDYKRKSALGGLSDEAQKLREINALFSEALDIQAFTDEVNERISGVCDTLNDALSAIADAKAVAGAKPSKTPLEVAEKVAEVLETLENGEGDFETIAVILKSEDFVQKPSTIERRVRKAVAEGFKKVEVTATGYKLVA